MRNLAITLMVMAAITANAYDGVIIYDGDGNKVGVGSNGALNATITDAGGIPAEVDNSTHTLQTIDYAHHETHAGSHYYISGYMELNDGETNCVKLVTPDTTKWSHVIFDIKSTGICSSTFDEDATGSMTGGVAVAILNNNRNSTNTSGMTATMGVSCPTGYTTRLENDKWGAAGFKESIGGGASRDDELVLKQNTVYARTFISGADNNIIQFKAAWYEHTNK